MAWGLNRMSSLEFAEWIAFYSLEPFGDARADLRSAIVAKTIADVHIDKESNRPKLQDFIPRFEGTTPEEQLALAQRLNEALGGIDEREG